MEPNLHEPAGGDQNKGLTLVAFDITFISVTTLVVALRLFTRKFISKCLGWDDWTIVMAWVRCFNYRAAILLTPG